jgi:hypothetical protein
MGALSNEPPIRVRNGSMKITLDSGAWKDDGDAWSPSTGNNGGGFTVTVDCAPGFSCEKGQTASGKEVWVLYSDKTEVTFKSAGSSGKTKVQPKNRLAKADPQELRYGQAGDKGYIIGVGVKDGANTWSCTFSSRDALSVINIIPMPNERRAQ